MSQRLIATVVDIGQTDHEQIRSSAVTADAGCFGHVYRPLSQRPTWPKRPASVVIDSATYLLTISSPDGHKLSL